MRRDLRKNERESEETLKRDTMLMIPRNAGKLNCRKKRGVILREEF